jgi:hypothetical protein
VVDLDAAFGEEFLDVAVGQTEAELPVDREHDHIRWEAEAGERRPCDGSGSGGGRFSWRQSAARGSLTADATAPVGVLIEGHPLDDRPLDTKQPGP